MSSLNSLKQILRPLGFYNLQENSLISAELAAYAAVLDDIENQLLELEQERFIVTAQKYGLDIRERIFGKEYHEKNIEDRRNLLLHRYSINSNDFNESSFKKIFNTVGLSAYIIEYPLQNKVYINCIEFSNPSVNKTNIKNIIQEFLPAHLEYIFDLRNLHWDLIDSKNNTFNEIDAKNLTWDDIDNLDEI